MKTKETFKVVMLPTEKAENCIAMYHNGKISYTIELLTKAYRESANIKVFQLHIISNGEIKESEYFEFNKEIYQLKQIVGSWYEATNNKGELRNIDYETNHKLLNKIVATRDRTLIPCACKQGHKCDDINCIPNILESFVIPYIKSYNDSKSITQVDLEVDNFVPNNGINLNGGYHTTIKTRPDNTVIVHQSKMYSRDEVIALCKTAFMTTSVSGILNDCCGLTDIAESHIDKAFSKWIEDNL